MMSTNKVDLASGVRVMNEESSIHGNGEADAPGKEVFDSFHQLELDLEVTEQPSKECSTCRLRYPLHGFNRDGGKADGLMSKCRGCHNAYSREYDARYRQAHGRSLSPAWQQANRERHNAYRRAWRAQHRADDNPTERNLESALQADRQYRELLTEQGARRRRNEATDGPVPPIVTEG